MLRATSSGVEIDVRVIPRAKKTALGEFRDGVLVVRVAAPPVEGAANDALIEVLAEFFDLPRRAVSITSGVHSRHKRVAMAGLTPAIVEARLNG